MDNTKNSPKKFVLHIYRAPSGQISGRLYDGDLEICAVAGCSSVDEVKATIEEQHFLDVSYVVDGSTGEGL